MPEKSRGKIRFDPFPAESAPPKELLPRRDQRQPGNAEQFLPVVRLRSSVRA
jgi:hypothetical protein